MTIKLSFLTYCRIKNQLSQESLGKKLGKSRESVLAYEKHKWHTAKKVAEDLARIFADESTDPQTYIRNETVEITEEQYRAIKKGYKWANSKKKGAQATDCFLKMPLNAAQRLRLSDGAASCL